MVFKLTVRSMCFGEMNFLQSGVTPELPHSDFLNMFDAAHSSMVARIWPYSADKTAIEPRSAVVSERTLSVLTDTHVKAVKGMTARMIRVRNVIFSNV